MGDGRHVDVDADRVGRNRAEQRGPVAFAAGRIEHAPARDETPARTHTDDSCS